MAVLYIKEQGAIVKKMGERVQVVKNTQVLLDIPLITVDSISVIGNIQVTAQALRMFMENGIDVAYFAYNGKYLGHTCAESSKNIFLRFEQYQFYLDEGRRLEMARCIIRGKITNQIALIRSHRWETGETYNWKSDIEQMQRYQGLLVEKKTTNEVMGIEGICSNIYFNSFGHMIKGDFIFEKRNRRPPKDPVNIILSLAYTFLTREMCNALDAASYETYLGFLHGIRYGRKSLALDLIEEFRQPAIDRFVILLFNKRIFGRFDFDEDEDGINLNEDGFRKFCAEYERWMTGKNSLSGDHFRKRIQDQVSMLRRCICKGETYQPYHLEKQTGPE